MRAVRCYICGKELAFAENISIRFYEKKLRTVKSKGFYHLERQKDGSDKAKWNAPYTTEEYAQTAIGSFCTCKKCGMAIYESIKSKKITEGK
jgi:hypothetical protein